VLQPGLVEDPEEVAQKLAPVLGLEAADILEAAKMKDQSEVWIKRQITADQSEAVRSLELDGVRLVVDTKRYYPQKDFLTQVLGYTTVDGVGQEGIEAAYNKYLRGEDGLELTETDRDGNEIAFGTKENIAAKEGNEVELTIDYVIQAQKEGKKVYFHCSGGRNRTGTVAMGTLLQMGKANTVEDAEKQAVAIRPIINVKPELKEVLHNMFEK